jgi:hypothetical protein
LTVDRSTGSRTSCGRRHKGAIAVAASDGTVRVVITDDARRHP